jgi:hypothetical protein
MKLHEGWTHDERTGGQENLRIFYSIYIFRLIDDSLTMEGISRTIKFNAQCSM